MKKILRTLLLPVTFLALTGCTITSNAYMGEEGVPTGLGGEVGGDSYEPSFDIGDVPGGVGEDEDPEQEKTTIPAGQLTCSCLDDNKEYDYWNYLAKSNQEGEGIFQGYKEKYAFDTFNRLKLTVNNAKNATVTIKDSNEQAHVDNFNEVYLFPKAYNQEYTVTISYLDKDNNQQSVEKVVKNNDVIDLENESSISNLLEIMFVIDATGSMGDEMRYLQSEIDDVIANVKENNADADITMAMMVYRDKGDDYVTRYQDFTKDITTVQSFLAKQEASGGGDFEEAVDVALDLAISKQWSANSTKLLFHVADAPAHDQDVPSWNKTALLAASKGIKIFSVASSGINKKTEYFFRSQSLLTGGQYVYLTNHSGIGGEHLDATTKETLVVEYLNAALSRLISGYYSGTLAEPIPYNQVVPAQ